MREAWIEVKFEDICNIISGKNQKTVVNDKGKYPIYGSGGIIGYANEYLCNEGTTIIGRKGTINSPIYVREKFWNVDTAFGFSPYNNLENRLLYFFCILFNFKKLDKSTAVPSLAKRDLLNIDFPLPPLPEQRAIVKKIEQLFTNLEKGVENLKTTQEQLKVYRQAVLKKAFEGELTKEWRAQQKNLPTADELLKQIKEERENHYQKQLTNWKPTIVVWEDGGEIGKKPGKPKKLTIPEEPNKEHYNRMWDLPNHWTWSQIGQICFVTKLAGFEYTQYVNYDESGDFAVIKAENAGINGFKQTNFSMISSKSVSMLTRSVLNGGELLIVFVGAGTGSVATVPFNRNYFLGPNIGMARPYFDINTKYLEYYLQSPMGKHVMMTTVKAVAQPSLSMGTIRQTPVALPFIEEQHQIVKEIESRLSVANKVEESIKESLLRAEALRQSILKKAFEGELLTDEELEACRLEDDWEPAGVLLDRIKRRTK